MTHGRAVSRRAYAKLNLMLSVGPAEPAGSSRAGWHPIASWMAPVNLWDDVTVTPDPACGWSVEWAPDAPRAGTVDWAQSSDLASRAIAALEQHLGQPLRCSVRIVKRIPTGGGLGGGSADAAAALLAAREAFGLSVSTSVLAQVGSTVGSDVPFFLDDATPPRPALVSGFGDTLERVPIKRGEVVLIFPGEACSTPEVYRAFDQIAADEDERRRRAHAVETAAREIRGEAAGLPPQPHRVRRELIERRMTKMAAGVESELLFNDLAPAALHVRPVLAGLLTDLRRTLREPVHVTGSGSTLFVVTRDAPRTAEKARRLADRYPGLAVVATSLAGDA